MRHPYTTPERSLGDMLDSIPESDLDVQGAKKDSAGVSRLKARQAEEAKAAKEKYENTLAIEQQIAQSEALKGE